MVYKVYMHVYTGSTWVYGVYMGIGCTWVYKVHIGVQSVHGCTGGPDGIPNWVLKEFAFVLAPPVCEIINTSFFNNALLGIWKCADVTPFPKVKRIEDLTKVLRPISLTPTLVQEHLKPAILEKLGSDKYGCIPKTSTTHALINMLHSWSEATDGTSSDVRRHRFCISMEIAISESELASDCFSEWKSTPAGVPQGTKLGPWLFIVMIDDLKSQSAQGLFKYVDDTTSTKLLEKDNLVQLNY
ncbi:uncharacterized protein LOC116293859 [Actinia tenebrosa]|uniref:Uncharacterized protein LOC116293859 n=1 Tax=Actinia tenebrosa TaxID=6105 RepID=A0A6P8HX03_ACTTE|nr:uncharacterized protein LOC116293859 [Actinia tenebrosa]